MISRVLPPAKRTTFGFLRETGLTNLRDFLGHAYAPIGSGWLTPRQDYSSYFWFAVIVLSTLALSSLFCATSSPARGPTPQYSPGSATRAEWVVAFHYLAKAVTGEVLSDGLEPVHAGRLVLTRRAFAVTKGLKEILRWRKCEEAL